MTPPTAASRTAPITVLPVQVTAQDAALRVLRHLPDGQCVDATLLHHPYAGYRFHLSQRVFTRRIEADLRVLVDLRSGAAATSDAWPDPVRGGDPASLRGPAPRITEVTAHNAARQCVVRTALHRGLSLRHPTIELRDSLVPLYKPNWLLTLHTPEAESMVLVDAITGGFYLMENTAAGSGAAAEPGAPDHPDV